MIVVLCQVATQACWAAQSVASNIWTWPWLRVFRRWTYLGYCWPLPAALCADPLRFAWEATSFVVSSPYPRMSCGVQPSLESLFAIHSWTVPVKPWYHSRVQQSAGEALSPVCHAFKSILQRKFCFCAPLWPRPSLRMPWQLTSIARCGAWISDHGCFRGWPTSLIIYAPPQSVIDLSMPVSKSAAQLGLTAL